MTGILTYLLRLLNPMKAMQTAGFFRERRERADFSAFKRVMKRKRGEKPRAGDERK